MYGVVVCSRCGRAKAADLRRRSTKCQCGYLIDLRVAVVRHRDPSALRVAEAVRAVASGEAAGERTRRGGGAIDAAVEAASSESGMWAKAFRVAEVLTRRNEHFTAEEFSRAMVLLDVDRPEAVLEGLVDRGLLVTTGKETYASV